MEVKRFEDFEVINEAFGSRETSYGQNVKWRVMDVISDVNGISEKDFRRRDALKDLVDEIFNITPEISESLRKHERQNSRVQYCAEHIYQWFIKGTDTEKNIKELVLWSI